MMPFASVLSIQNQSFLYIKQGYNLGSHHPTNSPSYQDWQQLLRIYSLVLIDSGGNEVTHIVIVTVTPRDITTTLTTNVTSTELTEFIQQLQGPLWTGIIIVGALAGLSIIISVLFVRKLALGSVKVD